MSSQSASLDPQIQPLADSVVVKTPPRGTPAPRLPKPAPIEPEPSPVDLDNEETSSKKWPKIAAVAAVLITLLGGGLVAGRRYLGAASPAAATGTLIITTNPAGVPATVDGEPKGTTPLTLTLTNVARLSVDMRKK